MKLSALALALCSILVAPESVLAKPVNSDKTLK